LAVGADGKKSQRLGLGVGGNYWDLISFGGSDAPATIYLFDTLRHFAELERVIAKHPEWKIATADADDLSKLAEEVRTDFKKRFWSTATGRFVGWIDVTGQPYDFGFTMVNTDAIHYGLASPEQAQSIFAWLDGKREIAGDTSRGADIYHWRFGARTTTRRNTDTYVWAWPNEENTIHVTHDAKHLFFRVRTREALTPSTDANWMVLLLDTDQDAKTGHFGYDYRLNHTRSAPDIAGIEHWNGKAWEPAGAAKLQRGGTNCISPLSALRSACLQTNPCALTSNGPTTSPPMPTAWTSLIKATQHPTHDSTTATSVPSFHSNLNDSHS
jgi:hypothetical protein